MGLALIERIELDGGPVQVDYWPGARGVQYQPGLHHLGPGGWYMLRKLGRIRTIGQDPKDAEVPPGQFVTEKFPVLTFGSTPKIDLESWRFKAFGLVQKEIELDWEQFKSLEMSMVEAPFHCVTQWSRLENTWEGVRFTELMKLIEPEPNARHVMVHCFGGYSTNPAAGRADGRRRALRLPARRGAPSSRARRAPAPGGAQEVRVEKRQVGDRPGVYGRGRPRVLGGQRLSPERRPLGAGAVLGRAELGCQPLAYAHE